MAKVRNEEVRIDPEFAALIPPFSADEYERLKDSILAEGCHDALTVWGGIGPEPGILVDGHNRYKICTEFGVKYYVRHVDFADRDAAKIWIIQHQLARRNLTMLDRSLIALKMKQIIAARAKENQGTRTDLGNLPQNSAGRDTRDEIAKLAGVSHDTIQKVETIENEAPPELKELVREGEVSINAAASAIKVQKKISEKTAATGSTNDEWYTPPEIVTSVIAVMGYVDLDPCSNSKENPVIPAREHYTRDDDGLSRPWTGKIYLNPPYGREVDKWVHKLRTEYLTGNVTEAIVLLPAKPDTTWFAQLKDYPWCAVRGRLKFSGSKDGAKFPSAVFYLGKNLRDFYFEFVQHGTIYREMCQEEADVD